MTDVAEGFTTGIGNSRPDAGTRGHVPGDASMWLFVIGDLLIFGVYFVVYMYFVAKITSCSCTARLGSTWTSVPSIPSCC